MDMKPISDVTERVRGSVNPSQFPDEAFALLSFAAFDSGDLIEPAQGEEIKSNKYEVRARDVLFSKLNPHIPRALVAPDADGKRLICSTEFVPLRVNSAEELRPDFLRMMMLAPQFLAPIQEATSSSTRSHQRIRPRFLLEQVVPVPPTEEQDRILGVITECLTRISEANQLREETALEAEAVFPSSLAASFDDLGDVPRVTIGTIAAETRLGTSKKCRPDIGGIPVLRIPNVSNREIHLDNLKYCPNLTDKERAKLCLQRGDILIVRSNGSPTLVGRSAVVEMEEAGDYAFASYLIRLRLDPEQADAHYVNYFLTSSHGRRLIDEISRSSSGLHNVSSSNLREIELPLPSLTRQRELVERMHQQRDAARRLVEIQHEGAEEIGALTGAVLRKAFAGEL